MTVTLETFAQELKVKYQLLEVTIGEYQGGYPTLLLELTDAQVKMIPTKFKLKMKIRHSEMYGGQIVGVSANFLRTTIFNCDGNILSICCNTVVMESILDKIFLNK